MKLQRVIPTLTLAAACALGTTSVASAATTSSGVPSASSENWSGYVVGGSDQNNPNEKFKSVTGSWTVPTAKTSASTGSTYSAFWVGLGGSGESDHLEQDGVEVNVSSAGKASYYAWYELVPKAPVKVKLAVSPGDKITATTSVDGDQVTETIDNTTTGQSFSKTLTMSDPDTSSAEWIAEAPSQCTSVAADQCSALPLTDFGKVDFSSATATNASGHTGSISDSSWTAESVSLDPSSTGDMGFSSYDTAGLGSSNSGGATPSSLSSDGASFSVSYSADSSGESGGDGYGSSSGEGEGDPYGYGYGGGSGYGSSTGGYGGASGGYGYGSSTGGYSGEGYGYGSSTGGYGGDSYGYGGDGYGGYGVLYQTSNGSWVYVA